MGPSTGVVNVGTLRNVLDLFCFQFISNGMFPVKDHITMPEKNQPINLSSCNVPLNSAVDDLPTLRSLENRLISHPPPPSLYMYLIAFLLFLLYMQSAMEILLGTDIVLDIYYQQGFLDVT